jgi:hypothetical protein
LYVLNICIKIKAIHIFLRGDFLPNRVFGAQKYRHALRENGRIVGFLKMAVRKLNSMNI